MPEAQSALDEVKRILSSPPGLTPPTPGEPLLLYIAATTQVVSAALVVEREEEGHVLKVQRPVYYFSEVLSDPKSQYPQILKILYVMMVARRKLRHYFDSYSINVVSSFPLREIIQNRDSASMVAKWALELMGQDVAYMPQTAIKSKALVDFLVEWTEAQHPPAPVDQEYWVMYFDGSLMRKGAGVGLVFVSPLGVHMKYAIRLHFPASNNVAEYEALVNGLKIVIELGIQ